MEYYLAPLEGITTYIFRNAYHHYFGGIDKYFTPFISSKGMSSRELNDILPEHNKDIPLVPQILTNRTDEFLAIAGKLETYGYTCVNLNLGCPSGTVTAKKRGSGFLSIPDELDAFLTEIFEKCPLKISIKTRIGVSSEEEWEHLLSIFGKYPVDELIIHPRLQQEFYNGTPHKSAYAKAEETLSVPLCYNGDIISCASKEALLDELPQVSRIMIGRGILRDPNLILRLKGKPCHEKDTLKAFHEEILENYIEIMSGEAPVLYKMKDLWFYMSKSFTDSEKYLKKIRKANSLSAYKIAVNNLFCEQEPVIF